MPQNFTTPPSPEPDRFHALMEALPDGVLFIDAGERVVEMNTAAERLTGWSKSWSLGRPLEAVCRLRKTHNHRPCQAALQRLLRKARPAPIRDLRVTRLLVLGEDLAEQRVRLTLLDLGPDHGAVLIVHSVEDAAQDLLERRRNENSHALGQTTGLIAHKFNNLLTAILGNLSLALRGPGLHSGLIEQITAARSAGLRAHELAQQLQSLAKTTALSKSRVSLESLVRETLGYASADSGRRLECAIAPALWNAELDRDQIGEALHQLCLFAQRLIPEEALLRVDCTNFLLERLEHTLKLGPGNYLRIRLHAEGARISEEDLGTLFEPDVAGSTSGGAQSLAAAHAIVGAHGGVLQATVHAGQGATFEIFLPALNEPGVARPHESEPSSLSMDLCAPFEARVLIIDDDAALGDLLTRVLEPLGYDTATALSGAQGIALYHNALDQNRRFDLVICDLRMPGGLGGEDTVRRLRELDPEVKAIVSTGDSGAAAVTKFREHGFCGVLLKPYDIGSLGRFIAECLGPVKDKTAGDPSIAPFEAPPRSADQRGLQAGPNASEWPAFPTTHALRA